ncbi:MAG: DUF4012 domain-containing protein [Patescibacteria group bacterium]
MSKPRIIKTKKMGRPKIHIGTEAPASPYVIDLRRPVVHHPIELTPVSFDPRHDLVPTEREVLGQLAEAEFTPQETVSMHAVSFSTLTKGSVAELFAKHHAASIAHAFTTLELPEDEAGMAEEEEAEEDEPVFSPVTAVRVQFPMAIHLPHGWKKTIAAFVGLSFVFVLPIHAMQQVEQARAEKERITSASEAAISSLALGGGAFTANNFDEAEQNFARANANFVAARENIGALSGAVDAALRVIPSTSKTYTSLTNLVSVGEGLSKSAELFSSALAEAENAKTPVAKLDILTVYLERMQPLLSAANKSVAYVDPGALPEEHQQTVATLKAALPGVEASLSEFLNFNQVIHTILGAGAPMRYLVLFQNNNEIRPTGGFIGSFAELTVENGEIVGMEVPGGGSYDLQGSLQDFVAAPEPLQVVRGRFEFQDANWFPDFPTSAQKLLEFYDHAGGPTVDGVLAVNATYVADLISLLGPVEMTSYGRTIDSENFLLETQKIVELEADKTLNKPKQFIADLAPEIVGRITSSNTEQFLGLLEHIGDGFTSRDLQLYFKNAELQQAVDTLGWSGRMSQTDGDYLMVVNANIGGGKTDLVIEEQVDVTAVEQTDGSIVNTVTISRKHTGNADDLFEGENNVNYVRVYVPEGSKLLSATGDIHPPSQTLFQKDLTLDQDAEVAALNKDSKVDVGSGTRVTQEFGKTVFGNWTQTMPGAASTVTFTYRLPFRVETNQGGLWNHLKAALGVNEHATYSLFIQKQPGVVHRTTTAAFRSAANTSLLWSSDDAFVHQGATSDSRHDLYFAALLQPK